jgi:hypothetical protein
MDRKFGLNQLQQDISFTKIISQKTIQLVPLNVTNVQVFEKKEGIGFTIFSAISYRLSNRSKIKE